MPKYSIITPMFNSFHLMQRYFTSLENQTYKDFEVILVDDCSQDNSFAEAKLYAERSSLNTTVLQTNQNGGPGVARNMGMDVSTGEWITFIDNDDWVEETLFEKIDKVIKENDVNCVIYDYYIQKDDKGVVAHSMYDGDYGMQNISKCIAYVRNHTWGKVYRRTGVVLQGIRYPALRRCEDVAFVCRAIEQCGSVYYLKEPLYYYYQRAASLSNNRFLDESDAVKAFEVLEENLREEYPNELNEKSVVDLLYGVVLIMCKAGKKNCQIKEYIKQYEKKYSGWENCAIIQHLGISKKVFLKAIQLKAVSILRILAWVHSIMVGS